MSKHNYTNYSKPNTQPEVKSEVEPGAVNTETPQTPVAPAPTVDVTVNVAEPVLEASLDAEAEENNIDPPAEPINGVVTTGKLNMRSMPSPDGAIVSVLTEGTKVQINPESSTAEWYAVYAPTGAEGFCMKKFIAVK